MIHISRGVEEARLAVARSTVYRWVGCYQRGGLEAPRSTRRGRAHWTVTDALAEAMLALSYLRSIWSSELLAVALRERHGLHVHASTLRRLPWISGSNCTTPLPANHRCRSLNELPQQVERFLILVQPFPGAGHGVAQFGSAI